MRVLVYGVTLVICAVHGIIGGSILSNGAALNVTSIAPFRNAPVPEAAIGIAFVAVALVALASIPPVSLKVQSLASHFRNTELVDITFMALAPQQLLLFLSSVSAVDAMRLSRFADLVVRDREFLIADQSAVVALFVIHALLFWAHADIDQVPDEFEVYFGD